MAAPEIPLALAHGSSLDLWSAAFDVRGNAYVPYSGFAVGAALATADGRLIKGVNIESAAFAPTVCAERAAIATALTEGLQSFAALAVASSARSLAPCGLCRQLLIELAGPGLEVVIRWDGEIVSVPLGLLIPLPFPPYTEPQGP
jgi:cytidine deaminase